MKKVTIILSVILVSLFLIMNCGEESSPTGPGTNLPNTITAFSFDDSDNSALYSDVTADVSDSIIVIMVPSNTNITNLVATFGSTGDTVKVDGVVQVSGVTANDFTNPLAYSITSTNGTTRDYIVIVAPEPANIAKDITFFQFTQNQNPWLSEDAEVTISGNIITAELLIGDSVAGLTPTFTITGDSVLVDTVRQVSNVTANDFSTPVTYTVYAANGTSKNYTVTVTLVPATDLTNFRFRSNNNPGLNETVVATVSGTAITASIKSGTAVDSLAASFSTNGDSVTVGGVLQTSGSTYNNFTNAVTYTVHGSGTTKNYLVSIVFYVDTIEVLGTWKTAITDTFTMVVELDSIRLQRTADTSVGYIDQLYNSSDRCVVNWTTNPPDTLSTYQKIGWDMLSDSTALFSWYANAVSSNNALIAYSVSAADTVTKQ